VISFLFAMALAAQQTVQSSDAIQIPNAIRPMIGDYMGCLNSGLQKRSRGDVAELGKLDDAVLADCEQVKVQAVKAADQALLAEPTISAEDRDRYVSGSFAAVEGSFRNFIQKLKSSASSPSNFSGQ
jgi:hypothetical protein